MHEKFMERCFELALKGLGKTSPNPLVGSVIVHNNEIIGEGYHEFYGGPHAEVNAINSVKDKSLLSKSILYVNLEPCNHQGKTPPCTDLILEYKIPHVVISTVDPNPLVSGKGIERLKENGVKAETGILEKKGEFINRRFFTSIRKKRPFVILKWAQTKDGFIDKLRTTDFPAIYKISNNRSHTLSHQWRAEEDAILIGKNTAINDRPELTVRYAEGKNPVRIVIDARLEIPKDTPVFNDKSTTFILTQKNAENKGMLHYHNLKEINPQSILALLNNENIQSLIIEGGTTTLQHFIDSGLWDEARVFTASLEWKEGLGAPVLDRKADEISTETGDELKTYYNK